MVIEALEALRGVLAKVTAVRRLLLRWAECHALSLDGSLMGYSGAVRVPQRGTDTTWSHHKTATAHLRRVIVEAAWSQPYKPLVSRVARKGQEGLSAEVQ